MTESGRLAPRVRRGGHQAILCGHEHHVGLGEADVDDGQQDDAEHDRLVDRVGDALGPTRGVEALVRGDDRGDEAEEDGLELGEQQVGRLAEGDERAEVGARADVARPDLDAKPVTIAVVATTALSSARRRSRPRRAGRRAG